MVTRRVITSLDEANDPDSLVWRYFDADRDAVIEATRQTLEATREDASVERVVAAVDKELIEALRFPARPPGGWVATLLVRRGWVAGATLVGAIGTALSLLLL